MRSLLVIIFLAACGASSHDSPANAGLPDALPSPDASSCGPGPHVTLTGTLRSYVDSTVLIAGATLSADLCPGDTWTSDAQGAGTFEIAKGVPFTGKLEHPDYIPMLTTVEELTSDFDASGFMIPMNLSSLLPHWSATTPTALLTISIPQAELPASAPAACHTKDGLSVTVVGHPEAVVTYFSGTTLPTPDPTLTATGPIGLAEISGLPATPPGTSLDLAITSPCPLATLTSYPHLPSMRLENGVLTVVLVRIPPLVAP
jgi:hypothetical protein